MTADALFLVAAPAVLSFFAWLAYEHTAYLERHQWRLTGWLYALAVGIVVWNARAWAMSVDLWPVIPAGQRAAAQKITDAAMVPDAYWALAAGLPTFIWIALMVSKSIRKSQAEKP